MTTTESFSSSGEDVLHRSIDVEKEDFDAPDPISERDAFAEFFDINRTVQQIEEGDYKQVRINGIGPRFANQLAIGVQISLQFPDELLQVSVPIYQALKSRLGDGRDLYVLADTSYGR